MKIMLKTTLVLSFFAFLTAAKAETFVVTTTDDDSAATSTNCNSTGDTTAGTCSIRGAISVAASGDIIELAEARYCITSSEIGIEKAVTLRGKGMDKTILDGGNGTTSSSSCSPISNVILDISVSTYSGMVVQDLTIMGGLSSSTGGIRINGDISLKRLKIIENKSTGEDGGGVRIYDGVVSIQESIIDSNTVEKTGSYGGGGIYIRNGTVTINQSVISNNTVYGRDGGGIRVRSDSANVTITNSTISGNKILDASFGRGGGINLTIYSGGSPTLLLQNSTVTGNTVAAPSSSTGTAGVYVGTDSTVTVVSSIIAGNTFGSGTSSKDDCLGSAILSVIGTLVSAGHNFIPSSTCSVSSTTGSGDITSTAFSTSVLNTTLSTVTLGDYETYVHAIPSDTSPLYNAGDCSSSGATTDQRNYYRDSSCDIGAHEFGAASYCGDATKDTLEECDDGNSDNTDSCIDTCENASCGDGYTQTSSEECDDGNTADGDGCSSTCTSETIFDGDGDGFLNDGTDCDDTNSAIYPGATESCNEKDDDCDGETDEAGTTVGATTWCIDRDGDGFGDENENCDAVSCAQPSGYADNDNDCDDSDSSFHPGATEVANDGIDQDCNGDDDPDNDGDEYFDDDCDDTNPAINPDATEIPDNGVDENCDPSDDLSGGSGGSSTGGTGSTGGTSGSESTSGSTDGGATGSDPNQQPASGGGGGCSFQAY